MLLDPTERNVNPFPFQTGIRTVKKLVLTLTIHDENVTIAKPARASITVRTGLAFPLQECMGPNSHRHDELRLPTPSKQRLIIAVPPHPRVPSPVKVQVRRCRHISLSTRCPTPHHENFLTPAVGKASSPTAGRRLSMHQVPVLNGFVPSRNSAACDSHAQLPRINMHITPMCLHG